MNDSLNVSNRYIAAGCPHTSARDLEELASDLVDSIRRRVAENPSTPLHCLTQLAKDICTEVRIAIAENPCTPKFLLEELLCHDDVDLRYSMAENCNLQRDILEQLAQDENPYVSHRAAHTLKRLAPPKLLKLDTSYDKGAEALECIWQVKIS